LRKDIWVCGLRNMTIHKVVRLRPRRVIWMRGVDAILELPMDVQPPPLGLYLSWFDARQTDPVRDPDREFG
jgi:hypothetical protein